MNKKFKHILIIASIFVFASVCDAADRSTLSPDIKIGVKLFKQNFETASTQGKPYIAALASLDSYSDTGFVLGGLDSRFEQYFSLGASKGAAVMLISNGDKWQSMLFQRRLHPHTTGFAEENLGMWFYTGIGAARLINNISHEYVHMSHIIRHKRLLTQAANPIIDFDLLTRLAYNGKNKKWAQAFKKIHAVLKLRYNYLGVIITDVLEGRTDIDKAERMILRLFEGRLPEGLKHRNLGGSTNFDKKYIFDLSKHQLLRAMILNQNSDAIAATEFFAWIYGRLVKKLYYPEEVLYKETNRNTVQEILTRNIDEFLFEVFASDYSGKEQVKRIIINHFSKYDIPFATLKKVLIKERITEYIKQMLIEEENIKASLKQNRSNLEQAI